MPTKTTSENLLSRFWSKVSKGEGDSCWLWTSAVSSAGYGAFRWGRNMQQASRIAWLLTYGDPEDRWVLHKCDNRLCVNPSHLFLGDVRANVNDMISKGIDCRGKGNQRLTDAEVIRLYYSYAHGAKTLALAKAYKITPKQVLYITRGGGYKRLNLPPVTCGCLCKNK